MTAKHRKGKSNHKQEDNFFKNEAIETEVRPGGVNNSTPLAVLILIMVVGGAAGAWFFFQQHQTLTYLTDNLMGIQMKIVKLQSSHEELRQSKSKQHVSEGVETRLAALEESYALTQKQVGMALATAEQLKTSDLPAQVLSLHTEMKARLAEVQQATVSLEQLSQLQSTLQEKSEEFEDIRTQVAGLATLNGKLSRKVEVLTESLGAAESMLGEKVGQIAALSTTLDGQTAEVLAMKDQLDKYQAQLEASVLEVATVRELLENEQSLGLQQASVEEQLNTVRQSLQDHNSAAQSLHSELRTQLESIQKQVTQLVGETQPPAETLEQTEEHAVAATEEEAAEAAAAEEEEEAASAEADTEEEDIITENSEEDEETPPAGEEQDPSSVEDEGTDAAEEGKAVSQNAAPAEQEDSETEESVAEEEVEAAEEDETEQDEAAAASEKEEEGMSQTEEEADVVEEEKEADEEETQLESAVDENQEVLDEDEREKGEEEEDLNVEEEQQDVTAEEEPQEPEEEEEEEEEAAASEDDASPEDK